MMKTIAVLGATGPTGLEVVKQALANSYTVRAIARDPSKLKIEHPSLKVFRANIFEENSLTPVFDGCDAVVSCLGGQPTVSAITLYSESMAAIVQAMRQASVKRLVAMSAAFCKDDPSHPFWFRWGARLIIGRLLDDIVRMESYLSEHCSDIDYTTVRPPQLENKPIQDKPVKTEQAYFVSGGTYKIPRSNVAKFILQCLETDIYNKKFIAIAL